MPDSSSSSRSSTEKTPTRSPQQFAVSTSEPSSLPIDARAIVQLDSVTKSFGSVRAFDAVDFVVRASSLVAIIGANGSGKTTLLRVMAGVIAPDSGSVAVLGNDPRSRTTRYERHIGYAAQGLALDPDMTGDETLRLFYALRGLPSDNRDECLSQLVAMFELGPFMKRIVASYSGGQRQRLHLALESMHGPALLLLDEPT